ncbi:MAG: helix-turn-helix domain-containing protein [Sedimentisphaerales bacterium]|nr:helix-turn-helix domain-containing protein [Sedimentisphaerales bacterium]MBN2842313.1 helix-turn-helix domain-containing protein [Sedimentisphaerales bacterium]
MSLGTIIRQKREKLGITLDELARLTEFSKPYLSTVETGKVKNPPSDDLLVRLEDHLGFERGFLLHIAHMERVPADIKHCIAQGQAENTRLRSLIRKLIDDKQIKGSQGLAELRSNISEPGPADKYPGKMIPIINKVSAGYPVGYTDLDYPAGGADDFVRCPDLHDPNAFALRVSGDSMTPKFNEGDIVIFSPNRQVENGDDCFVRLTDPHESTFKRVYFEPDNIIRLQPRNQRYVPLFIPAEKINGIWKAVIRYERL